MDKSLTFVLQEIRKGKRSDYPDYFIVVRQIEGYTATISRERNLSVSIHYHDNGMLTFDPQHVDTFENVKHTDLSRLNLLNISISIEKSSILLENELKNEIYDDKITLSSFFKKYFELEINDVENTSSFQWFTNLLNTEKDQQFVRHHLGTIRYFHGDFESLQEFLLEGSSKHIDEENSYFEDHHDLDFGDEDDF
ncbi:MAG: hypothetical protein HQM13_01565 [SAR324 cluster bacterium]|nr:hypothetical protein [SAR324 cluster bacterium]